jgi:hypothetical protein
MQLVGNGVRCESCESGGEGFRVRDELTAAVLRRPPRVAAARCACASSVPSSLCASQTAAHALPPAALRWCSASGFTPAHRVQLSLLSLRPCSHRVRGMPPHAPRYIGFFATRHAHFQPLSRVANSFGHRACGLCNDVNHTLRHLQPPKVFRSNPNPLQAIWGQRPTIAVYYKARCSSRLSVHYYSTSRSVILHSAPPA